MVTLNLNGDRLIRFPMEDSKANYLAGFWSWVELLAADDYQGALEALHWPKGTSFTPEKLKERVTTFWGGRNVSMSLRHLPIRISVAC